MRVDGPLKVSGKARHAYERNDIVLEHACGFIVGAGIPKGVCDQFDRSAGLTAAGVLGVVTTLDHDPLPHA